MTGPREHGTPPPWNRADGRAVLGLTLGWIVALVLVDPVLDSALNDDFAYAIMVDRYRATGRFLPTPWTFIPAVSNVWLGAGAQALLGAGHTSLRISTMAVGWLGMLGVFGLCRLSGVATWLSALGAAVYALQPSHFNLAVTFMTDVAFSAFIVLSLFGTALAYRGQRWGWALALLGSALAVLSRQPGAVVPVGIVAALALSRVRRPWHLAALLGLGALLLGGLVALLDAGAVDARIQVVNIALHLLESLTFWGFFAVWVPIAVTTLGLVCAPLLPFVLPPLRERRQLVQMVAAALVLMLGVLIVGFRKSPIPPGFEGNVLSELGVGPLELHGHTLLAPMPAVLRWALTLLGVGGTCLALVALARGLWQRGFRRTVDDWRLTSLLLVALFYASALILSAGFDRYFLPIGAVLPAVLLSACPPTRSRARWAVASGIALVIGTVSVVGTRDYLDFQRVRVALIDVARERLDAQAVDIEGGFEFDGYENLARIHARTRRWLRENAPDDPALQERHEREGARHALTDRIVCMQDPAVWPIADEVLISLSPEVEGFRPVERRSFPRRLSFERGAVHLHVRR